MKNTETKPLFEHRVIKRQDGRPYLERWAFNTPWFGTIKLHKIIASDDYCMHDHPWSYKSFILKGGYIEETPACPEAAFFWREAVNSYVAYNETLHYKSIPIKPFTLVSRPSNHIHRLILNKRPDGSEIPCWTLFFTGRRKHTWGFYTRLGWIRWKNYVGSEHCN